MKLEFLSGIYITSLIEARVHIVTENRRKQDEVGKRQYKSILSKSNPVSSSSGDHLRISFPK